MPSQITTYAGLKAGMLAWLARPGDSLLGDRFDDFLLNAERRLYYGHATEEPGNPLRSDPLRIPEMETVNPSFTLSAIVEGVVLPPPQPAGFLELISAQRNSPAGPLQIVSQRSMDAQAPSAPGVPRMIAVSGTGFRVWPEPGFAVFTATLRFFRKLATPTGASANDILASYPDVYLHACLIEASIFTQDELGAERYLQLYNASVAGLNARSQRITASAAPVIRLRGRVV